MCVTGGRGISCQVKFAVVNFAAGNCAEASGFCAAKFRRPRPSKAIAPPPPPPARPQGLKIEMWTTDGGVLMPTALDSDVAVWRALQDRAAPTHAPLLTQTEVQDAAGTSPWATAFLGAAALSRLLSRVADCYWDTLAPPAPGPAPSAAPAPGPGSGPTIRTCAQCSPLHRDNAAFWRTAGPGTGAALTHVSLLFTSTPALAQFAAEGPAALPALTHLSLHGPNALPDPALAPAPAVALDTALDLGLCLRLRCLTLKRLRVAAPVHYGAGLEVLAYADIVFEGAACGLTLGPAVRSLYRLELCNCAGLTALDLTEATNLSCVGLSGPSLAPSFN